MGQGHWLSQALPGREASQGVPEAAVSHSPQGQGEESALSWGWKLLASECPRGTRLALAKESVYRAQLQCHRAGQTTGLAAENLNQEQSSPIFKCLVSVLAVCVFQGISTFCISRLVA